MATTRYEDLKRKYNLNYITKDTLKKWVKIETKVAGAGITKAEYEDITGEKYTDE